MAGDGAGNCSDPIEFKIDKMLAIRLKNTTTTKNIYDIDKKYV